MEGVVDLNSCDLFAGFWATRHLQHWTLVSSGWSCNDEPSSLLSSLLSVCCHFTHVIQNGGLHTYSTSRRSLNKRRVWTYRNKCVRTRAVYQSNALKRTRPDVRALKWADVDACARTWTRTHALGCGCIRADVLRLRQTRVLKAGYSRPPPGIGLYTCVLFYVLWRLPFSTY